MYALGERAGDGGAGSQMNVRLRRCAAGLIAACAISLLAGPAGAAGDTVETPQGHAGEDAVELSPSAEARMSHAIE